MKCKFEYFIMYQWNIFNNNSNKIIISISIISYIKINFNFKTLKFISQQLQNMHIQFARDTLPWNSKIL